MGREGYLILDSDLHLMEPDDLWVRYLDEPYRSSNPPRFFGGQLQKLAESSEDKGNADVIEGMEVQGLAIPAHVKLPGAAASRFELRRRRPCTTCPWRSPRRAAVSSNWAPSRSSAPPTRSTASSCTTRPASHCGT